MSSNLFQLKWKDIIGAAISAVIVAILGYVASVANIGEIDIREVLNLSVLTFASSLLKALGTDNKGMLLGAIKVK